MKNTGTKYVRIMNCFTVLTYLVPVLFTFYYVYTVCAKIKKKNNSGAKRSFKASILLPRASQFPSQYVRVSCNESNHNVCHLHRGVNEICDLLVFYAA